MRQSYLDLIFTVPMTFKAVGGGRGGRIEIMDIWKIKNILNYHQLIIASASVDTFAEM